MALAAALAVALAFASRAWVWIVAAQAPPLLLVLGNWLLTPHERARQAAILREAKARLAEINPTVIGVTGSFGKTTVKHMLGNLLGLADDAYYTPGSINTPMGISRIIREKLPPGVSYFIVEMGAYGPGSIARLCALTPPKLGIITALGEAHYERFKSLDAVARTKFELAEAVINNSSDGKAIVHESVLEQPFAREFVNKHKQRFSVCGAGEGCDFRIVSSGLTDKGVALILRWEGRDYEMFAPLFGAHNIGNLAVTFAAAVHCGVAPEVAIAAMRKTPQVAHRLEVRRPSGERIIIDDAYNANAKGFEAALELLSFLANGESRRVLVTPGMVELGAQHDKLHRDLGASAAKHADTAIVVQPERIRTFVEAFKDTAPEKQLVEVATFNEAQAWVDANVKEPAVILLENDLPDLYERRMNT
jgi:UDP-N-acetylmuramoyl-tripeptide--D-alanyl-D-alanine ligase